LPLVVSLLHSRRVAQEAVAEQHLDRIWHISPAQAWRRVIEGLTVSLDRKTNVLTVAFGDRVPARARAVVAAIVERATVVSTQLWAQRNRVHQQHLEGELSKVGTQLSAAEAAFRQFRERTHVVDLPAQTKATVEQAAALEQLRIGKTLDLRFARTFGEGEAVEVQKAERQREAAAQELAILRHGKVGAGPLLPLDELPKLEVEHARLKRVVDELTARRELLALKVSQLIAAEARPGGLAEMIDPPVEPQTPSGPSTIKLVLAGAVLGTLIAFGALLLLAGRPKRPSGA
jgi:uncharacterized protein involved in exopolysaccharide biosynthesis